MLQKGEEMFKTKWILINYKCSHFKLTGAVKVIEESMLVGERAEHVKF